MNRNQCQSEAWGKRFLMLCAMILCASLAFGQSSKLSKDLQNLPSGSSANVIVQYKQVPGQIQFDRVSANGGSLKRQLAKFKGAAFSVPAASLQAVANDPDITHISPDRQLSPTSIVWGDGGTTPSTTDYYDQAVIATYGWGSGLDGTGIGVAVIDSGINSSLGDLSGRVAYSKNFDTSTSTTSDLYGHGSHVAGIIGGNGASSSCSDCFITFKGIAPNVNLINLRVLDQNGVATDSEVIQAIQTAISLKSQYNIRVINLSLGRPVYESYTTDPLDQAVEQAWQNGIVVVVAAGNEGRNNSAGTNGYATITAPGNDPYVITVGAMKPMSTATRADDLIATYSSKGPTLYDHIVKPDIVAPGNLLISSLTSTSSTLYTQYPGNAIPQSYYRTYPVSTYQYYRLSGTSMSTGVVSGAVALMLQKSPSLTPDQVKARLLKTAYKTFPQYSSYTDPTTGITYTSQYDILTVGAGYLDIQAALSNTDLAPAAPGSTLSPTVTKDASGNVVLVNGTGVIWGTGVSWGTGVVWGTGVIWGTNVSGQSVLWGSGVCWGTSTMQGYGVIWGTGVVWGTSSTPTGEAVNISINGEN